jgi:hypothetical protein
MSRERENESTANRYTRLLGELRRRREEHVIRLTEVRTGNEAVTTLATAAKIMGPGVCLEGGIISGKIVPKYTFGQELIMVLVACTLFFGLPGYVVYRCVTAVTTSVDHHTDTKYGAKPAPGSKPQSTPDGVGSK